MSAIWTDGELGLAADATLTAAQVAEELGRSVKSVHNARSKLRSGWAPVVRSWTDEDDEFLRSVPHYTAAQIGQYLGRSRGAVNDRCRALGIRRGSDSRSPLRPGLRRLVAKTCNLCGELLSAEWFCKNNKGWQTRCSRCIERPSGKPRPGTSYRNKERLQRLSLPYAHRSGSEWTDADDQVLADQGLTLFEKAVRLGRTYCAVNTRASINGYKSKVGLGDKSAGRWVIDNPNQVAA